MPVVIVGAVTLVAILLAIGVIVWRHKKFNDTQRELQTIREWTSFTTELENRYLGAAL